MEEKGLIIQLPTTALEVFNDGGLDPVLTAIEAEVKKHIPVLDTARGRDEIRSLASKVAKSKTYLDGLGKDLVSEWKKKSASVDAERRRMREKLDSLRDETRQPLTEWERAEEKRVAGIREIIQGFHTITATRYENATQIQEAIDSLTAYNPATETIFAEFQGEAQMTLDMAVATLTPMLEKARQHEADQAELARLRREQEERVAKEAKEQAEKEAADAKAKAEQERKEREESIAREAEERAAREADERAKAAERREAEAKAAAERAEKEKKEAADQAERDRIAAEQKAKEDQARAVREAEDKAKAEADRRERERLDREAAEKAEADKKTANVAHRRKVNRKAIAALVKEAGLNEGQAEAVVTAIAKGFIPGTTINY